VMRRMTSKVSNCQVLTYATVGPDRPTVCLDGHVEDRKLKREQSI
jgi:hypothetical protein